MAEAAGALTVGDRCEVHPGGKPATVRYVGKIPAIGPGWWVGVQYDKAIGKNTWSRASASSSARPSAAASCGPTR